MATVRIAANDTTVVQIEDGEREALVSVLAVPGQDPIIFIHRDTEATVQASDNANVLVVTDGKSRHLGWRTPMLTVTPQPKEATEKDIER